FGTRLAQLVADLARDLGGEGAVADARRIRLADADDRADIGRTDAGARARAAGDRARAGHERIRAAVDVEQRALRAFHQDALARAQRRAHDAGRVADHRRQLLAVLHEAL